MEIPLWLSKFIEIRGRRNFFHVKDCFTMSFFLARNRLGLILRRADCSPLFAEKGHFAVILKVYLLHFFQETFRFPSGWEFH